MSYRCDQFVSEKVCELRDKLTDLLKLTVHYTSSSDTVLITYTYKGGPKLVGIWGYGWATTAKIFFLGGGYF